MTIPGRWRFPAAASTRANPSVDAALREAEEETGLDPAGVEVLGVMPELALPRGNFLVTPVLGWWASQSPVRVVDYGESAQVFRVPVRDLLDPDNRVMATVSRAGQTFQSPAFTVNDVVVWGFTGMILNQLFDQLGWAVPWDRDQPAQRRHAGAGSTAEAGPSWAAGAGPELGAATASAAGLVDDQPGGGVLPHGVDARGGALDAC